MKRIYLFLFVVSPILVSCIKSASNVHSIPPTSEFSTAQLHGRPYLNFTIENDSLNLTLSHKPLVHAFFMDDSITWVRSMNFAPTKFLMIPRQNEPVSYSPSMQQTEARIYAIYSDPAHLVLFNDGGIVSETFKAQSWKKRKKIHRKLYQHDYGWSNEMIVPSMIGEIPEIIPVERPSTRFEMTSI